MPIERRHVGKRLSDIVVFMPAGERLPISPDRSPRIRRPMSPGQTQSGAERRSTRCWPKIGSDKTRDPVGDDLSSRHEGFPGDERRVGRVGAAGPRAGARDRRGEARQPDYKIEIQVVAAAPAALDDQLIHWHLR